MGIAWKVRFPSRSVDVLDLALIALRFIQYGAASILTGSALFFVYALPRGGPASPANLHWANPLLATAAISLALGAIVGLIAQVGVMAGSLSEGLRAESLAVVITGMGLGKAAIVRAGLAALAALILMIGGRGRSTWRVTGVLGALATATFPWMGHGAATEGSGHLVHLAADILHSLAAAVWLGALLVFVLLAWQREQSALPVQALRDALHAFSKVGIAAVATLVISGAVNAWFLVDLTNGWQNLYVGVLLSKLALFGGMVALAAYHRQRSVPALTKGLSGGEGALTSLRRSLRVEGGLGFAVLALVAWLGMLSPVG
jgi:putative copper resistance protein D